MLSKSVRSFYLKQLVMSVFRSGKCSQCPQEGQIVKTIAGRLYCFNCNKKRLNDRKINEMVVSKNKGEQQVKSKNYSKNSNGFITKRKTTGELAMFKEIFEEREKECTHCLKGLPYFNVSHFAHIKAKGKHPELRLDKNNIRILCFDCHFAYDHQTKEQFEKRKKTLM